MLSPLTLVCRTTSRQVVEAAALSAALRLWGGAKAPNAPVVSLLGCNMGLMGLRVVVVLVVHLPLLPGVFVFLR